METDTLIGCTQLVDGTKVQRLAWALSVTHWQQQTAGVEDVIAGSRITPPKEHRDGYEQTENTLNDIGCYCQCTGIDNRAGIGTVGLLGWTQ